MMLPKKLLILLRRNYLKKLLKIITLVSILPISIGLSHFFEIKTINCIDNQNPCDEKINESLTFLLETSVLKLKQQEIFNKVSKIKPIKSLATHYQPYNTLKIEILSENRFIPLNLSLVLNLPKLSFNQTESSSSAVYFQKPSLEIKSFSENLNYTNFNLWFNGEITPIASQSTNIYFLMRQKPEKQDLISLFELLELSNKYLKIDNIYILERTIFLSRDEQPDIITSVPYNRELLLEALHSLDFLTTMKKYPKIIDLRYKNPIIR